MSFNFTIRQRLKNPPDILTPVEHSLTAVASSVNEGGDVSWDFTTAWHGNPTQVFRLTFAGQAAPLPAGTFTKDVAVALQDAQRTGVTYPGLLTLEIDPALWDGLPIRITRPSVARPEAQGNLDCSLLAYSPTVGVVITAAAVITIVDTTVIGGSDPVTNAVPPSHSNTASVGVPLQAVTGQWLGTAPITKTQQWELLVAGAALPGTPIGGATTLVYTPVAGDVGKELVLAETADNAFGAPVTVYSTRTSPVVAAGGTIGDIPSVAGPNGVFLTNDSVLKYSVENTVIGEIRIPGATVTGVTLGNTFGNRIKLLTAPHRFAVGSFSNGVTPGIDFEHEQFAPGYRYGVVDYQVPATISWSGGAPFAWTVPVRARYPFPVTTGGDGFAAQSILRADWCAAVKNGAWNRRLRMSAADPGVVPSPGGAEQVVGASNLTIESPPGTPYIQHKQLRKGNIQIRGDDIIVRGLFCARGGESGGTDLGNGDSLIMRGGKRVIFDHPTVMGSTDELMSFFPGLGGVQPTTIPQIDTVLVNNGLFAMPCGGPEDPNWPWNPQGAHVYGVNCGGGRIINLILIDTVILGITRRGPQQASKLTGFVYQGSLTVWYGNGCWEINGPDAPPAHHSGIVRDNLVHNVFADKKSATFYNDSATNAKGYNCFQENNWQIEDAGSPNRLGTDFAKNDPVTIPAHLFTKNGGSSDIFVNRPPFRPAPELDALRPNLATEAARSARWNYLLDNCGARARTTDNGGWLTGDEYLDEAAYYVVNDYRNGLMDTARWRGDKAHLTRAAGGANLFGTASPP